MKRKVSKAEEEWREQLTPEQYRVARQKGTERPFTGQYDDSKEGEGRAAVAGGSGSGRLVATGG